MKCRFLLLTVMAFFTSIVYAQVVKTGVEVLSERQFDILKGKKVGLITNPTGVDKNLKSTVDILHESPHVQLVALYAPEHGVRGDIAAGEKVAHTVDAKTGVKVFSLYGNTRKPTQDMLQGVNALVYDIQDIGKQFEELVFKS